MRGGERERELCALIAHTHAHSHPSGSLDFQTADWFALPRLLYVAQDRCEGRTADICSPCTSIGRASRKLPPLVLVRPPRLSPPVVLDYERKNKQRGRLTRENHGFLDKVAVVVQLLLWRKWGL